MLAALSGCMLPLPGDFRRFPAGVSLYLTPRPAAAAVLLVCRIFCKFAQARAVGETVSRKASEAKDSAAGAARDAKEAVEEAASPRRSPVGWIKEKARAVIGRRSPS